MVKDNNYPPKYFLLNIEESVQVSIKNSPNKILRYMVYTYWANSDCYITEWKE